MATSTNVDLSRPLALAQGAGHQGDLRKAYLAYPLLTRRCNCHKPVMLTSPLSAPVIPKAHLAHPLLMHRCIMACLSFARFFAKMPATT